MFIIKVGGGKAINWDYIAADLASLVKKEKLIIVHGGKEKRDEIAKQLGKPTRYVISPSGFQGVYTDKFALEVLTMVYAGLINKQVVAKLLQYGIKAFGLSGVDGRICQGFRKQFLISMEKGVKKVISNTYTGKVEKINTHLLKTLLKENYVPVITQPAVSYEGGLMNTDNDRTIAVLAKAMHIKKIIILFAGGGFLRNPSDKRTLIEKISKQKLANYFQYAQGGMKKLLLGAM